MQTGEGMQRIQNLPLDTVLKLVVLLLAGKAVKQTCVSLSTAESEYVAHSSAAQKAVWLCQLYKELILMVS